MKMKFSVTLILAFYFVATLHADNDNDANKDQEDEPWIWGYVDNTEPTLSTETPKERHQVEQPLPTPDPNPCIPYDAPRPDFTAPGRKISVTKCYEYIWEIKNRDDRDSRARQCFLNRRKKKDPYEPHFAIGGRDTLPGEFPHMGAIGWKASVGTWIFKCGSSLISSKFVLTAAHCSKASSRDTSISDPVPKIVRLGDKNIIDIYANDFLPLDVNISRIIVHPNYASPKQYFDIALMELDKEVKFTKYVQPACLWTESDVTKLGIQATLTGWGVVETAFRTTSPELQAAVVDLISSENCDEMLRSACYRNWCGLRDHQLCAGKLAGGVDACQGDSGGPLQVKIPLPVTTQGNMNYVVGVISFGVGCALENSPGVYTRVSSFIDWIEGIVWP